MNLLGDIFIKDKLVIVCLILFVLMGISSVSATDINVTDGGQLGGVNSIDKALADSAIDPLDELDEKITNSSSGDTIYLQTDYYCSQSNRSDGIVISTDNLTIDGQGHFFDGNGSEISNIFTVYGDGVALKSIKFVNWELWDDDDFIEWNGYDGKLINCTFIDNIASSSDILQWSGIGGTIESCTFTNNSAIWDDNMIISWSGDYGTVNNSFFENNSAFDGGIIYWNGDGGLIHNSTFANNFAYEGGAIYWECSRGLINSSTFINCSANSGGAIYCTGSRFKIVNSTFENNSAEDEGGAVYCNGYNATISSSRFMGNNATWGGGLYCTDNVYISIEDAVFMNNSAYSGGAAIIESEAFISNSKFINNTVNETGGALFLSDISIIKNSLFSGNAARSNESIGGAICGEEDLEIGGCNFTGNSAQIGGAVVGEYINVKNSTFDKNKAENGGAMYLINGEIAKSTFTKNTAVSGGAIIIVGNLTVNGSSFKGNAATDGSNNILALTEPVVVENTVSDTPVVIKFAEVVVSASNVKYGDDVRLRITLKTFDAAKLNGGSLSVTINNKVYKANVKNNVAEVIISKLNVGNYSGSAIYKSDYYSGIGYCIFSVLKDTPKITAKDANYIINYGGKYSITLKNSNGKVLSGQKVSFTLAGKNIGSAKTNAKGVATIKLTAKILKIVKSGKKKLIIKFSSSNCNAVSKTVKINVKKEKTKIVAKKKTFKKSKKVKKYTITLKNSKNKAVKKVKVTLKVKGKTYKAKTNNKGKATFKITKLNKKGKFKATVKFKSNSYYSGKTKKTTIKVKG